MTAIRRRLEAWLSSRRLPLIAALAAALLTASSLGAGLATEDYLFRVATQRQLTIDNVNLYDAEDVAGGVELARYFGTLPWITFDGFRVSFWRPLASLTHWIDYRLWPGPAWRLHLESIALYALLAACVAWLYRRILPSAVIAGGAALLYAIDDAHGHAVGWLANRHALLGALLGTLALVLHDRWRRDGSRLSGVLSSSVLGLALSASELSLSAVLWIVAHAATLETGPFRRRLLAAAPALGIAAIWAALTRALGHGSTGSDIYIDPLTRPLTYLTALPERAGVLLLGQLGGPPSDTWHIVTPSTRVVLAISGVALALLLAWVLMQDLRRSPELRFFALGAALSVLPPATTFPSDRLLYFVGIGASALIATLVGGWLETGAKLRAPRGLVAPALVVVHALVAPVLLPQRTLRMADYHRELVRASDSAYSLIASPTQRLIVVNAPDYYYCKMLREVRWTRGYPDAVPLLCLAGTLAPTRITRLDPNALELSPVPGFLDRPFNRIYRDAAHPMRVGMSVFVGTAQITITEARADGAPQSATFRFAFPLESDQLRFVAFDNGRYRAFVPPAPGSAVELP